MKKENEYIKNTIILLAGKFSTQLISLLLLPLYTHYLETGNYGYIDIVQTYISLFAPILLLQLDSAVFRYLIDIRKKEEEKKKIISTSLVSVAIILLISTVIVCIIKSFITINYFYFIIINLFAMVLYSFAMSVARGNGNNLTYSISSIITAVINLLVNLVLILAFGFDAKSILIAGAVANIFSIIYVFIKEKIKNYIDFKSVNKNTLKDLLKYSLPMIPNALSWWVVGLSDRTMVVYFISTTANGIYSVSCKFSNLLNNVFSIFSMSWQENASMHINDKDCEEYFSKMIIQIFNIFLIVSCGIVGLLPLFFNLLIGKDYLEAYNYIPISLIANLFNVLVGLLGGIYVAKKMTKQVALTTIYSAVINVLFNLVFIKILGLYAACISTLIAYFIMMLYRYFDIRKVINIQLKFKLSLIYIIGFIFLIVLYYIKLPIISIIITSIICIYYMFKSKDFVIEFISMIKNRKELKIDNN